MFLLVVFAGGFKVGKLVISSVGDEVIVHNVLIVPMNIMLISIYSTVYLLTRLYKLLDHCIVLCRAGSIHTYAIDCHRSLLFFWTLHYT